MAEGARDLIRQICQAREVASCGVDLSGSHHMLGTAPPSCRRQNWYSTSKGGRRGACKKSFRSCGSNSENNIAGARVLCATVGAVDEKTIKDCIENQKWDEEIEDSRSRAQKP